MKMTFCMKINIKVSYKLCFGHQSFLQGDTITIDEHDLASSKSQSNKFAISLQHLKKEVRDGVHFLHVDKHQNFYKLALSFLMEVARCVQSTQNRKLLNFLGLFDEGTLKSAISQE